MRAISVVEADLAETKAGLERLEGHLVALRGDLRSEQRLGAVLWETWIQGVKDRRAWLDELEAWAADPDAEAIQVWLDRKRAGLAREEASISGPLEGAQWAAVGLVPVEEVEERLGRIQRELATVADTGSISQLQTTRRRLADWLAELAELPADLEEVDGEKT